MGHFYFGVLESGWVKIQSALTQIETLIVRVKKEHPSWGAPKIREKIRRLHSELALPAISTVHAVLDRHVITFTLAR